jgi:Spy/CpxP family protein refolding chaperone
LRSEQQKRTIRSAADRRIARMELEELLNADTLDQKAIDVKLSQLADLETGKLRARVDQQVSMRKVLTPEQFKKWQQLRPARGERAAARRSMRDGRPGRWNRGPRGRGWGQPEAPMAPAPPRPPGDPGEPR